MYKAFLFFLFACLLCNVDLLAQKGAKLQPKPALLRLIDGNLRQAANQYKVLMGKVPPDRLPKTYNGNSEKLETSNSGWWTSGFYPGTLLYLYGYTHDTSLRREALQRLSLLEKEQYNKGTHDLGFMMYCSYGNARHILGGNAYDQVLMNSARSLSTRFNPKVGCIRSWDSPPWKYPVIIDNMMNLELLFWATQFSGDSSFYRIAVTHANTTLRNHFRPDFSSFHVVDYDTATGNVLAKKTAQGFSDSSAWARGQSWGLYGYTVMYRSTHDRTYLELAERIAHFILTNPHLPADKIPYWDYTAGAASPTFRDASAAAILASALIELSHYVDPEKGRGYLDVAEQIIVGLSSNNYKAVVGSNGGFLLKHSVGNIPGKSEIDVPLTYADYYFVEAMLRYRELNNPKEYSSATTSSAPVFAAIAPTAGSSISAAIAPPSTSVSPFHSSGPFIPMSPELSDRIAESSNPTVRAIKVADGWARNSINAVIFRHNSLITVKDTQFIAFYDGDGRLVLGKRRSGAGDWQLQTTPYKGNTTDAHNSISLTADGDGYLHVAWDHHNNPLRYCRSISPGSLQLGEKLPMTGQHEEKVSYPEFYPMPGGDLIFLYRDGASGNGNLVIDRYDHKKGQWTQLQSDLIDGEGHRNAYWQACVDARGAIQLSWVWRESPDVASNHDICYARSADGGRTWEKTTGEKYSLPITMATAEYAWHLPQHSELINQTSMSADGAGRPFIATYWRAGDSEVPQYRLVWHDGRKWNMQTLSQRMSPFTLSGGGTKKIPISRPQILLGRKGDRDQAVLVFRDEERGNKVSIAVCNDFPTGPWHTSDLTTASVGAWEPSYDTEYWRTRHELDLFVQNVQQGDGETLTSTQPTPISVLECIL